MTWQQLEDCWRQHWKPPEKLKPSDWAEKNMRLSRSVSAEAGPIRLSRTPYVRGIVDCAVEPVVEEIVFVAGTQVAKSTSQEILLGFWIDNDPGPCLIVKPSESATEEAVKERLRPLIDGSPALARHKSPAPHDNTLSSIKLDTMNVYLGWAGSPQSLASRPCRYVLPDECDKFPPFAGREADPLSLARERMATYLHRRRMFNASTPTTREGAIWRAWEGCGDKRRFHVPCPHCGEYQLLAWSQVKWPKLDIPDKVKRADVIERDRLAWYECSIPTCKGRIEESHKTKMLERGVWVSYDADDKPVQTVNKDGKLHGERPVSKRVGFHLSSLYSPWRKFYEMVAEFIRAEGDVALTMNFRNSRLAEPFEQQISKTEPGKIREKSVGGPAPRIIPDWARVVIATADTQQDHFYYVVRAWSYDYRSQLVDYGIVSTFEELKARALDTGIPMCGNLVLPHVLLIDSGGGKNADTGQTRTNEVYQFALSDPTRIIPIKGATGRLRWPVDKSLQKAHGIVLWNIDTEHCKDHLSRLVADPDTTKWAVCEGASDDYCAQMASEHKIIDPKTKVQSWQKKTSGAANHFWDCEVYQCAAAWDLGCGNAQPETQPEQEAVRSNVPSWVGEYR